MINTVLSSPLPYRTPHNRAAPQLRELQVVKSNVLTEIHLNIFATMCTVSQLCATKTFLALFCGIYTPRGHPGSQPGCTDCPDRHHLCNCRARPEVPLHLECPAPNHTTSPTECPTQVPKMFLARDPMERKKDPPVLSRAIRHTPCPEL